MSDRNKPPVGTIVRRKMMANGNVRVEIEYEATEDLRCAQLFPHGSSVVAVPISAEAAKDATTEAFIGKKAQPELPAEKVDEKPNKGPWGKEAQALHKNGFYNSPTVQYYLSAGDAKGAERKLKEHFGVDSMTHVHPGDITEWALIAGLIHALPLEVRAFPSTT